MSVKEIELEDISSLEKIEKIGQRAGVDRRDLLTVIYELQSVPDVGTLTISVIVNTRSSKGFARRIRPVPVRILRRKAIISQPSEENLLREGYKERAEETAKLVDELSESLPLPIDLDD